MKVVQIRRGWDPFAALDRHVNRLLDAQLEHQVQSRQQNGLPLLNVFEAANAFHVVVELPGVRPEQIELNVTEDAVDFVCARQAAEGIRDEDYRRQERWHGSWRRHLPFPVAIKPEEVTAELVHGMLKLVVPKARGRKPRRVPVAVPANNGADRKGDSHV